MDHKHKVAVTIFLLLAPWSMSSPPEQYKLLSVRNYIT